MEADEARRWSLREAREGVLAKLAEARTILSELRHGEAIEWQQGYIKALEEMLGLQGLSLRRSTRVVVSVPAEILAIAAAETPWGSGTMVELSATGCRVGTAMPLEGGDSVTLSFRLPGSVALLTLRAAVVRVMGVGDRTIVALDFRDLPLSAAGALAAFLALPPSHQRLP